MLDTDTRPTSTRSTSADSIQVDDYLVDGIRVERYRPTLAAETSRPPLICVHGGGQASWCWQEVAPIFAAAGFEVKALLLMTPVVSREVNAEAIELPLDLNSPWGPPPPEMANQLFFQGLDTAQCEHYYGLLVPESPLRVHDEAIYQKALGLHGSPLLERIAQ